jgi:hypothetical protein
MLLMHADCNLDKRWSSHCCGASWKTLYTMSRLGANIFLIATTSNYLRSSAVCKNQSSKSWLFWFSSWNIWNTIVWIRCKSNCQQLLVVGFFSFISNFSLSNLFIFEPKNIWVFFPLNLCHWSQFWHQKYWKNRIVNSKIADFCELLKTVCSSKQLLSEKYWHGIYSFIYTCIV